MVVRDEPHRPATAAEQEALKQLLDVASDLSKASLLSLLRQCGGDPDKAMEQLYTLASTREEGHMSRYGSSDMGVEIIDDVEPVEDDDPDAAVEEMVVQATGEFGGKFGSSPTGSDDEGVGHRGASKQPTIHTTGQISATYRRATISMGGLINLGCDLDGEPVYSFINEGIRFVDIPIAPGADSGNGMVDAVVVKLDLAVMDDDEFKAVCDSWLLENYSSSEDSDAAVEFDYGAGGEFSVPKKAAATRSDPTEFRAYLNALLNESPEERARRIEQERLDDFLAQELYEEELREYERQWPGPPRPVVSDPAPAAPPAPTSATNPATEAMLLYDKLDTNSRAAYAPPATRVAPVSAAPRKPRPPGMRHHHRGAGGPQSQITVPSHRDVYAPRSIQVLLPASVRAVAIQNIVNPALERRFTEAACRMRRLGYAVTVDIAYHGTESTATSAISRGGFIAPLGSRGHTLSHRSGNSGFYGNGIYLTPHASIAQGYSSSGKIIVCNVLRGRAYKCPGLTMGASLKPGYSSHESPCGSEWVFFSAAQVLPVAIVHFGTQSVGRPEVLDPIASNQVDDPTELAMASANAELTRDVRKKQQQVMTPAKVAHLEALPATRLSNRDRKILNRIRKGKGLQQQTDVATGGRRRR